MKNLHRNKPFLILVVFTVVFFLLTLYLLIGRQPYGYADANSFQANVIIEVSVGGLFAAFLAAIGVYWGTEIKKGIFYEKVGVILEKIRIIRAEGNLEPEQAQDLVIEISRQMDEGVLQDPIFDWNPTPISIKNFTDKPCRICNLTVQVDPIKPKCAHCKLSCFSWEEPEAPFEIERQKNDNRQT